MVFIEKGEEGGAVSEWPRIVPHSPNSSDVNGCGLIGCLFSNSATQRSVDECVQRL